MDATSWQKEQRKKSLPLKDIPATGEEYGTREFLHPVRILTSTVKVDGEDRLVPVRSDRPIPKELLMDCMAVIRRTVVKAPVSTYDIIIPDVCGCGANIVATGCA